MTQLPAAREQGERDDREAGGARRDHTEAHERRHVGQPEEAVAEAVDHIKERIEMRQRLPERRQRMDRVEHARQKRERHDQEVLERSKLVELVGRNARYYTQRSENRAAQYGERQREQWMGNRQ